MVDVDIEDLDEENNPEPIEETEAEQAEEANKSVTEELKQMRKMKETIKESKEKEPEQPEKELKPKTKTTIDLTHLNTFKSKIIKDFGLTESIDSNGCYVMKYDGLLVFKLLPRKNCWYGVWREVPEDKNKWRAMRVYNEDDEQTHYNHIKLFIEANKE